MLIKRGLFSLLGLAFLAMGAQLPARAQTVVPAAAAVDQPALASDLLLEQQPAEQPIAESVQSAAPAENLTAESLTAENPTAENLTAENPSEATDGMVSQRSQPVAEADALAFPADGAAVDIAQARRRTSGNASSPNFIGVGADFGTGSDTSLAVISKFALSDNVSVRPSVLIGNRFAALLPVTYDFSRYSTEVGSFQILPYAGAGVSYVDRNAGSNFGGLITAGVDVPLSRQFTGNVQANYAGIFSNDSNFGVTVGVGYSFGGL